MKSLPCPTALQSLTAILTALMLPLAATSKARAEFASQQQTTVQPSLGLTFSIEPTGFVDIFGGNFAPEGAPSLNGQLLPIASNLELFSHIGTIYGGDGVSSFAVPDLQGRTALGSGSITPVGQTTGQDTQTLSVAQYPAGMGGAGQPFSNVQPSLNLNYVIALQGTFPQIDSAAGGRFLGEVKLFAGDVAPQGWTFANGNLLPINQNQALFAILGTTYGGNGTTTFALPNLTDRAVVGAGTGAGLTPRTIGQTFGTETTTLTDSAIPIALGGAGISYSNIQPSLALNYLVALQGIYPAHDGTGQTPEDIATLGELTMFAGNFAPGGWAKAGGTVILPIAQFSALFSLYGTLYGGDGVNTFALPDLAGRVAVGATLDGLPNGLTPFEVGEQAGQEFLSLAAVPNTGSDPAPVPEPASLAFVAGAFVILAVGRRLTARRSVHRSQ